MDRLGRGSRAAPARSQVSSCLLSSLVPGGQNRPDAGPQEDSFLLSSTDIRAFGPRAQWFWRSLSLLLSGSNQRRRAAVVALHRGAANLASLGSELLLLDVQQEPPGGSEGSGTFLWQLLVTTVAAAKAPSIVRFWWCPEKHTPVVLSYRRSQNHRTDL